MKNKTLEADIGRSGWSLRERLFQEIDLVQAGKSTPQRAQAVAKLAAQIIESAKVEVTYGTALSSAIQAKVLLAGKEDATVSDLRESDSSE